MKLDIIYNQHCLPGMRQRLPDECIDLIACDPQYGWNFMGRDWDKAVPSVDIWRQCFRVLKPGAFAFIMSGPRLDCLIENGMRIREAGFNVSFTPIFWAFSSGFPKAQNIGKVVDKRNKRNWCPDLKDYLNKKRKEKQLSFDQINKMLGVARTGGGMASILMGNKRFNELPTLVTYQRLKEILNLDNRFDELIERKEAEREIIGYGKWHNPNARQNWTSSGIKEVIETKPATPQAQALDGSYAGFQPKPSVEVVIVAMKPLSEKTYVDQALKNRKGISWLDEGRIPYKSNRDKKENERSCERVARFANSEIGIQKGFQSNNSGRFPANLLCSDDVLNDGRDSKGSHNQVFLTKKDSKFGCSGSQLGSNIGYGDSGSFSRYFSLDAWFDKKLKELPEGVRRTFPFLITPKASKAEKNRGCEGLRIKEYESGNLIRKVSWCKKCNHKIDMRKVKGHCCCNEPELYYRQVKIQEIRNNHPTCKPIKLMSWLIILGSREGDVILDPFIGSGTTGIAAKMFGRHYIGYEISKEYCKIANSRLSEIQLELIK